MCVVMVASQERLTEEMVRNGWYANSEGGGVAWREKDEHGTWVRWKKGIMDLDTMIETVQNIPSLPYIAHFRIASIGGKRETLCHPFPIEKNVSLALEGKTKGNVLFHNGHWNRWKDVALEAVLKSNTPFPTGRWSDTRAMAFVASIYGPGMLELIDEKAVVFGPESCEIFAGTGWKLCGPSEKTWCSNDSWKYRGGFTGVTGIGNTTWLCRYGTCKEPRADSSAWCEKHAEEFAPRKSSTSGSESKSDSEGLSPSQSSKVTVLGPQQKISGSNSMKMDGDTEKKVTFDMGTGEVIIDRDLEAVGGNLKHVPFGVRSLNGLPFSQIDQLFQMNKISKKQWKKARKRAIQGGMRAMKKARKQEKKAKKMKDIQVSVLEKIEIQDTGIVH